MKRNLSKKVQVAVSDQVDTKESLVNYKPWFNGPKQFSSVKISSEPQPDSSTLEINVVDAVASGDKVGG